MASLLRPRGRARRWLWWPAASPKSGRVPALRGPLDVQWGEGQLGGRLEPAEDGEGEDLEGPGALSRASRASLFGSCLGHTQPCHLPVIWAPDGASGLHEVESVGLARTVREIPLALVHHFSMDQDESPWQGHSRSGEHSGQEGTWWAVPSLKQWCGFFVPLLIPGTSGAWSLPPVGSCVVGRGFPQDQVLLPWLAPLQASAVALPSASFPEPGRSQLGPHLGTQCWNSVSLF